jgi:transposase
MGHVGIDVRKNSCQVCALAEDGELVERRIKTGRSGLHAMFRDRPRARILIESSTEGEWVARCLGELGHEVTVAGPNFAPMSATRRKEVKTDERDARTLCEACRPGAYRPAHRTSGKRRGVRAHLAVRETLVRTRAECISLIGALARREGCRLKSGVSRSFAARVGEAELPAHVPAQVGPLLIMLEWLDEQIRKAGEKLAEVVRDDEVVHRLTTAPGVGPVTATTYAATLDGAARSRDAKQARSYLGLVPREHSPGEKRHRGRIGKAGNSRARSLLVEAAWALPRWKTEKTQALHEWALRIAARRGKATAVVALARELAGILFALWPWGAASQRRYALSVPAAHMSDEET